MFVKSGQFLNIAAANDNIGKIMGSFAIVGGVHQMWNLFRCIAQQFGSHQVRRQNIGGCHQQVAAVHAAIRTGSAFIGVNAV